MLYVDYTFDMHENGIMFDEELKLKTQPNTNGWGNLPTNWKDGDLFMLKVTPQGKVVLHRKPD
jgi:hypothetical protein